MTAIGDCRFETDRLTVGAWHRLAFETALDLEQVVSDLLTETTTAALPEAWRGGYSRERARRWIGERDDESPTLLIIDRESRQPLGLLILFGEPIDDGRRIDLRIGYLLDEAVWGRGLAGELVAGLVGWARRQSGIASLSGGVSADNPASARVLTRNGFTPLEPGSTPSAGGDVVYRLEL